MVVWVQRLFGLVRWVGDGLFGGLVVGWFLGG
jgi:hypothetical protein